MRTSLRSFRSLRSLRSPARRLARLARLAAAFFATAADGGCGIEYRACAVQCGDADCPRGLTCAGDGFCHAPGEPAECVAPTDAGSAGRGGAGGPGGGGPPGGAGAASAGAAGNAPGGAAGAPSVAEVARACAAARVECGPTTDPNGRALDCGSCAGPSRCDAGKCACTTTEWVRSDLDPKVAGHAGLTVTPLGETHLAFVDGADDVILVGRRHAGLDGFEAIKPVGLVCDTSSSPVLFSPSLLALTSTPDGVAHLVFCAQNPEGERAFRYFVRPPGGDPVEAPAPSGEVGLDPVVLAGPDGALHLFYTHDKRVRYRYLPPGAAWSEPETARADATLRAAAVSATALVAAYAVSTDTEVGLARRSPGTAEPWRQTLVSEPPPRGGTVRRGALSLLPDERSLVAYNVFADSCAPMRNCSSIDSYVVAPQGDDKVLKNHLTVESQRPFFEPINLSLARDDAGRSHLASVRNDEKDEATFRVTVETHDGNWHAAEPVGSLTAKENAPVTKLATSASGLHLLADNVLFERCL
jgi:hypothetical protein